MGNEYSQLDEIFANGEALNVFPDKIERQIYPVAMKNFAEFMKNLTIINSSDMWVNFLQEDTEKALLKVLSMSFKEDIDDLQSLITAQNYKSIISKIMSVNGINISKDKEADTGKKE